MTARPPIWRDRLFGPQGFWRQGLAFWGGLVAQIALARQGGLAVAQGDALTAVWVLGLGLAVGLFLRSQKRRLGEDLALIPLLMVFTLPANLAEMILTAPHFHWGWKALAATATAATLISLRTVAIGPGHPPGGAQGPTDQD